MIIIHTLMIIISCISKSKTICHLGLTKVHRWSVYGDCICAAYFFTLCNNMFKTN